MKITGKITVKAIDDGLLIARSTSRQAIAKVAFTSRASAAPMPVRSTVAGMVVAVVAAAHAQRRLLGRAEELDVRLFEAGVVDAQDGQRGRMRAMIDWAVAPS